MLVWFSYKICLDLKVARKHTQADICRAHITFLCCFVSVLHENGLFVGFTSSRCWIAAVSFSKSLNLDSLSAWLPGQVVPYCCVCIKSLSRWGSGCMCQQNNSRSFWIHQPVQKAHTLPGSIDYTCFSCGRRKQKWQKQWKSIITGQRAHDEYSCSIYLQLHSVCRRGFL